MSSSGMYPNNTYPLVNGKLDEEQEKRKQARQESALTKRVASATPRASHPPLTNKFTTDYIKKQQTTNQPGVS